MFTEIGVKEQQPNACESFTRFGETHRLIEKKGIEMLKRVKPVLMVGVSDTVPEIASGR